MIQARALMGPGKMDYKTGRARSLVDLNKFRTIDFKGATLIYSIEDLSQKSAPICVFSALCAHDYISLFLSFFLSFFQMKHTSKLPSICLKGKYEKQIYSQSNSRSSLYQAKKILVPEISHHITLTSFADLLWTFSKPRINPSSEGICR